MTEAVPLNPGVARGTWRREYPLALVLAAVVGWLWPVVTGQRTFFYRDLHHQSIGTARLLAGETPGPRRFLWDPLQNGGQPLLGNPNRAVLYPSRVLYPLVGAVRGMNLEIVLHLLLGAAGAYFLTRRVGVVPWAAAVAALAWSLGGVSVSLTNHLGRLLAFHWIPWVVLASWRAAERDAIPAWSTPAVLMALQLLTGGLEIVAASCLTCAVWVGAVTDHGRPGRRLLGVAGATVGGVLLAGIQIVPAAAMVARSARRGMDAASKLAWSVHPLRLVELAVPGWFGPVDVAGLAGRYWGEHLVFRGLPYLLSLYTGAAVLALAVLGLRNGGKHRRLARSLALLGFVGMALSLGRHIPGAETVVRAMGPLLPVRFPVKAMVLASVPLAVLAALGSDTAARTGGGACSVGVVAVLTAMVWGVVKVFPGAAAPVAARLFHQRGGLVVAGISPPLAHTAVTLGALALVLLTLPRRRRGVGAAVALVVAADLLSAATAAAPTAPAELLEDTPPAARVTATMLRGGRLDRAPDPVPLPMRVVEDRAWAKTQVDLLRLDGYTATAYGVPMIYHADDPELASARYHTVADAVPSLSARHLGAVLRLGAVSVVLAPAVPDAPWAGRVVPIPTPSPVSLFAVEVTPAPRRAWFVPRAVVAGEPRAAAARVLAPGFDPDAVAVVEPGRVSPSLGFGPAEEIGCWTVTADGDGWVVLSVPWLPGLEAWDGSRRMEVVPGDAAFSAVKVGPGRHRIRLLYRPPEVLLGLALSLASLTTVLAVAGRRRRRAVDMSGWVRRRGEEVRPCL